MKKEDKNSDQESENSENDSLEIYSDRSETEEIQLRQYQSQITEENFKTFYESGVKLKNENKFEESFIIFQALLTKGAEIYGSDLDINLSMSYFQLGNSLLEKIEQSTDVFSAEKNLKIRAVENESEKSEEVDSIQVAWENLEYARIIMSTQIQNSSLSETERNLWKSRLANTYLRLGECQVWKEDFAGGVDEYGKCLDLLEQIKESINPRRISEVHFQKANAYLYLMGEDSLEQALYHFKEGRNVLNEFLERQKGLKNEGLSLLGELREIIRNFEEKIEEVEMEIETKDEVSEERKKIQELMSHGGMEKGFAKSEFDEKVQPIRNLGKFGKKTGEEKEKKKVQNGEGENNGKGLNVRNENEVEVGVKREPILKGCEGDRIDKRVLRGENSEENLNKN